VREFSAPRIASEGDAGVWFAAGTSSNDLPIVGGSSPYTGQPRIYVAEFRPGGTDIPVSAPEEFQAVEIGGPAVRLTFRPVLGATREIFVNRRIDGQWSRVATLPPDASSWTDTDVVFDHAYSYQLETDGPFGSKNQTAIETVVFPQTLTAELDSGAFRFRRFVGGRAKAQIEGSVSRVDGGALDLRASGLEMVSHGTAGPETLVSIPPSAAGWTERRGVLRFRSGSLRFEIAVASGTFKASWSGMWRGASASRLSVQLRCGPDAGTTTSPWGMAGRLVLRLR
jgi:hypothetical protein